MSKLEGLDKLNRRLNAIQKPRPLLRDVQLMATARAKQTVARKTGNTGRTIRPGELTDSFTIVRAGGAAPFLEFDTKPHIIKPRNKRALAWPATAAGARLSGRARAGTRRGGNGGLRFAKIVRHPGTKKQPFLVPAAKWALEKVGVFRIVDAWNKAA